MPKTLIEKILEAHAIKKEGNFIYAQIDFMFSNDITGPLAVRKFEEAEFDKVEHPQKICFICDHFTPARDKTAANNVKLLKEFCRRFKIKNFFDIDRAGIEHAFLPQAGFVFPGELLIGADSHTCTHGALGAAAFGVGSTDLAVAMYNGCSWFRIPSTLKFVYKGRLKPYVSAKDIILYTIGQIGVDGALYKVMEFAGPIIRKMNMDGRFTLCNMAVEGGAKTGLIAPDKISLRYLSKIDSLKSKMRKIAKVVENFAEDKRANYERIYEWDLTKLEPQVSVPHLPSKTKNVSELSKVKIDQVVIGSCTNGRLSDLKEAALILAGKKVKKGVRAIVFPATSDIYQEALRRGIIKVFLDSGFIISPPTCGPCLGGHMGVLAEGEIAVSTTNRNFVGRMGSPESLVYLASPAVAAASAIKGRIAHPREVKR